MLGELNKLDRKKADAAIEVSRAVCIRSASVRMPAERRSYRALNVKSGAHRNVQ